MRRRDDSFAKLLRWYPAWWRAANGDVLVGTLRDQADHSGRPGPSRQDTFSAIVNGLGTRLNARFALWSAVAAIALGAAAWIIVISGAGSVSTAAGWMSASLAGLAPILTLAGAVALFRLRGWITAARALLVLGVLTCALIVSMAAQRSWAAGFDLADSGLPQSGFAAAFAPLFFSGFVAGTAGLATLMDGLLRKTRLSWLPRAVIAIVGGGVLAFGLGLGLINPTTCTVIAVTVAIAAAASLMSNSVGATERAIPATVLRPDFAPLPSAVSGLRTRSRRLEVTWLGSLAVLFGTFGVLYAVTGSRWSTSAPDGTVTMGHGITILLAAGIPLLAAVGLSTSLRARAVIVWGPLSLAVLSVTAAALAYTGAPRFEDMAAGMFTSAGLGGAALAWWITPRIRGPLGARIAVGLAIGIAYSALFGIALLPMLAFTVPVLGVLLAVFGGRVQPILRHPHPRTVLLPTES